MSEKPGFIGLGIMGYRMAAHLQKKYGSCMVWNRTFSVAQKHEAEHGSKAVEHLEDVAKNCSVICICLPTSKEVESVIAVMLPHLPAGTLVIDCTSGSPKETRKIAEDLASRGVLFVDAPVSGGPLGAEKGTLCIMVGGPAELVNGRVTEVLQAFAGKIVHVGDIGCGMAVKAVNNTMLLGNLMLASEGLLTLKNYGVDPASALSVINASSGRSLQTEMSLPNHVLPRTFGFGFSLKLLAKDVNIAADIAKECFPDAELLLKSQELVNEALALCGNDADFTAAAKLIEKRAGAEISSFPKTN